MANAEFRVPIGEAASRRSGEWFWRVADRPGIRRAELDGLFGFLSVEGSSAAIEALRRFCRRRGFEEVA
jgi:hypothetical protein